MPDQPWAPDRSLGIFETVLVLDGEPVELDAHCERVALSARELFGRELPPRARELVLERAATLSVGRLRLTVSPREDGSLEVAAATAAIDPDDLFPRWERATALHPVVLAGGLGAHKWADREGLASAEDRAPRGCLPLVLDEGQQVLEASRANLFAVEDGALLTPPADGRILPGIARAKAIETAGRLGVEVREEAFALARLLACREVFLTGSVRGIEPVRAIADVRLAAPSPLAGELAAELERSWRNASRPGPVGAAA